MVIVFCLLMYHFSLSTVSVDRRGGGRADAFEFYLARPVPQGLTRRSPFSDTPPLYDATFIPYAG